MFSWKFVADGILSLNEPAIEQRVTTVKLQKRIVGLIGMEMSALSNYETQKCFQWRGNIFWTRTRCVCCLSRTRRSGTSSLSQIESVLGSRSVLSACREIATFSEKLVWPIQNGHANLRGSYATVSCEKTADTRVTENMHEIVYEATFIFVIGATNVLSDGISITKGI